MVAQLFMKLPAVSGIQIFVTVIKSCARLIQSTRSLTLIRLYFFSVYVIPIGVTPKCVTQSLFKYDSVFCQYLLSLKPVSTSSLANLEPSVQEHKEHMYGGRIFLSYRKYFPYTFLMQCSEDDRNLRSKLFTR